MNPEESKAKKCLFGRPDHKELDEYLKKELKKDVQEKNEKWNFDFEKGVPKEGGTFQWEKVGSVETERDDSKVGESSAAEKEYVKEVAKNSADKYSQLPQTPPKNGRWYFVVYVSACGRRGYQTGLYGARALLTGSNFVRVGTTWPCESKDWFDRK